MESLSSSFLQKYSPTPNSPTASPQVFRFKIQSVKIDEKPARTSFLNPAEKLAPVLHDQAEGKTTEVKKKSIRSIIFRSLDNFICKYIDPPLRASIDPKHVLSGNFYPVDELPPTACEVVKGTLPPCLDGAYIRNGPNPQFIPRGPYHLFDGDGMLHCIRIRDGEVKFSSRFIRTYKYELEKETGSPVILNVFSAFNGLAASISRCVLTLGRVLSGEYDPRQGIGTANTSLALFDGNLFALGESDLPYRIKLTPNGDIITLGRHESFGGQFTTMTAHPKIDAETQEAFAFRQGITFMPPFLIYFKINKNGEKQPEVPIFSLAEPSLIHDFAVSKKYAIFPDTQIVMNPKNILNGVPAISVDAKKVPRLGIIPRDASDESEMWWVEVPGFNMIHAVNAWDEDGDTIVMVAPNVLSVEHDKIVKRWTLATANLDFAVINPAYTGKKNRYIYAAIGSPMPKISGVVKIDTSLSTADSNDCTVASRLYGHKCHGGEAIFVPREPDNPTTEEDDGYLLTYVHNEITGESEFVVMDAKSPTLEIVAAVRLPQRVPYGFHGIFVRECVLKNCNLNPN
ncbi:putative carotenoid cleavage dioxygenase 4, chloroplastic-like [Dorcoceras hygrometricum]|uniref:Putative carotenoid cleavage dioxygenase 4, chloroplastic-like n=1 Tax=Dorcoceras hygrometricum TaxID=472368 RepID=A0A2Z7CH66_9LAMI|nr:putative carotenoid cleavage dioxygenase 4, chloroplastic-like [Dorcoceras hygrometricum]